MKALKLITWAMAASLAFASCSDDNGTDDPTPAVKTYTVTVTAGENGSATADTDKAEAGKSVTLTATADEGFVFEKWTATGVTLDDATKNPLTFTMPESNVTVAASFVAVEPEGIADILPLLTDEAFKEYVLYRMENPEKIDNKNYPAWDKDLDGKLSSEEAAAVAAMDLHGIDGFASLDDLKYFTELEVLDISVNELESGFDVFKQLTKLNRLEAKQIVTPEGTSFDLTGCPELTYINFYESYLYGIDVSTCSKLTELNIEYTQVDELDLTACSNLVFLDLISTNITKLDVAHCSGLQELECNYAPLTDVKLPQNSRLTYIGLGYTKISEFDATQHPMVTKLMIGNCPNLTSLDVTKCPKLTQLVCQYSPIGKLDLSKCPEMDLLWANCCKLTELNLSGCTKLYEVYCTHNNLTELDASDMGFYVDEHTGALTNEYLLNCGQQVSPGDEVSNSQWDELKHDLWNPVSKPITVYLRQEQMDWWENSGIKTLNQNYLVQVTVID